MKKRLMRGAIIVACQVALLTGGSFAWEGNVIFSGR